MTYSIQEYENLIGVSNTPKEMYNIHQVLKLDLEEEGFIKYLPIMELLNNKWNLINYEKKRNK